MEQEISLLRQENARLERLNRLLLDRIITLEQEMSLGENGGGGNEASLPHYNIMQWGNEASLPHLNFMQGGNDESLFHRNIMQRGNEASLPHGNIMQGGNEASLPHPQTSAGDKYGAEGALPSAPADPEVILNMTISKSLAEVDMKGAPHRMIRNVAKALLHISRGGNLDYNYVGSHYGYAKRSATKFIIALQRRGLLERRNGSRQLFLTEKGRKHLPGV